MNHCKKVKKLISKHFDNQINSTETDIMFTHLAVCPNCKKEFEMLNKIYTNFPKKQDITLNPYFNQKLKTFISAKQNKIFLPKIFTPAKVVLSLTSILFLTSLIFIKTFINPNAKNMPQYNSYTTNNTTNTTLVDEDSSIFGLLEFAYEIDTENYNFKEG
jgi:hypothetical protein